MDKKETDGKYNRRAHSVCCLTYHAVFVIKYRRKVIDDEIMEFMKNHTRYLIEDRFKGKMLEFNGEEDHIHILFELPPSAAPSVIVCSLKTQLSKEVRKRYMEHIHGKLWKDSFWRITGTGTKNQRDPFEMAVGCHGICGFFCKNG